MPGVTKEQIQAAREADLFTYLQFHEPGVLKQDGPNFRHKEHDSLVFRYMPQDLEERLNMQYMEAAQNPDMDKYRIPQGTAKQMLLYDEAPVYRLLPSGSEKIAPIAAISTGLWYENYREFAIAPEDLGALDKLIRRETDRLTGNLPQLHKNEERRPAPER